MLLAFLQTFDHSVNNWAAALGWPLEAGLRLVLAMVFGGIIGLEREMRGRQAGFRTNMLVCLGSALVMMVSVSMVMRDWQPLGAGYTIRVDPGRIANGVMMGIGFLGAGVIMRERSGTIHGLTTAAALWCVAAVGLTVGFGLYLLSLFTTLCILACLWVLNLLEEAFPRTRYRTITVRVPWKAGIVLATVERARAAKLTVVDASFHRSPDLLRADVSLRVAFVESEIYQQFERQVEADPTMDLISAVEI